MKIEAIYIPHGGHPQIIQDESSRLFEYVFGETKTDAIQLTKYVNIYCDDNFVFNNLPHNYIATMLYRINKNTYDINYIIRGDAMILSIYNPYTKQVDGGYYTPPSEMFHQVTTMYEHSASIGYIEYGKTK